MFNLRHNGYKWFISISVALFSVLQLNAQDTTSKNVSEYKSIYPYNKKRIRIVAAANIGFYGGMMIGLNAAWYSKYPQSSFHFFDDTNQWLQVDKVGHIYSAYTDSRISSDLWRWTGLPGKQRIWISGLSGVAYQTIIETLDGFSADYGWSWADFGSNVLGSGAFMAQELAWDEQKIKLKFSFHRNDYHDAELDARANSIYGKTLAERFLKDYNAQTYWMSVSIKSLFPAVDLPGWLSVAAGYGSDGLFGARSNVATDKNGNIIFNRTDVKRYRQWYFSPDIDLSRIKTKSKVLRTAFVVLNIFKFPAPSIEFSNGRLKGNWLHF